MDSKQDVEQRFREGVTENLRQTIAIYRVLKDEINNDRKVEYSQRLSHLTQEINALIRSTPLSDKRKEKIRLEVRASLRQELSLL